MDNEVIQALETVKSSHHREEVLSTIGSKILTPSEIADKTDMRLSHVSLYLSDLKKVGAVECLNENSKKGRLYKLTKIGEEVLGLTQ